MKDYLFSKIPRRLERLQNVPEKSDVKISKDVQFKKEKKLSGTYVEIEIVNSQRESLNASRNPQEYEI